jgi:Tripartite tricarboxylate transporter TctB family
MRLSLRHPKDFWSGVIFTAGALAFGIIARDYELGTATRMGPGFFPTMLAIVLAVIGVATIARSFVVDGEPIRAFAVKGTLLVLGGLILFGVLARGAGVAVALPVAILVSAYASVRFRWRSAILLTIALTLFSILVFVQALGLPIPIIGRWLGG